MDKGTLIGKTVYNTEVACTGKALEATENDIQNCSKIYFFFDSV